MLREFRRVLRPGGYLLLHTAPNRLFKQAAWPLVGPALRLLGHGQIADDMEHWFDVNKLHHVNEQSLFSLRRALREAGFESPRVWIDPDVLRSGNYRYTNSLDSPLMRLATRSRRPAPSGSSSATTSSGSPASGRTASPERGTGSGSATRRQAKPAAFAQPCSGSSGVRGVPAADDQQVEVAIPQRGSELHRSG